MKIIKLKGGLGNQLFQYAFAYLIQKLTAEPVKLDMTSFMDRIDDPIRKPRIMKLSISIPVASPQDISRVCKFKHEGDILTFKYRALTLLENALNKAYYWEKNRAYVDPQTIKQYQYFDGFWQSWRYVETVWQELNKELVPNYPLHSSTWKMINEVSTVNSVFIGIRKGDYTAEAAHYGSFGNNYFQKAMAYVAEYVKSPVFYIFSNDIAWVKKNINFSNRTVVFREPKDIVDDFEDLFIMAACKHAIIVNSTYHWWGAKLNDHPAKIVVAPKKWFFDDKPIDIVPPHWVQLEE